MLRLAVPLAAQAVSPLANVLTSIVVARSLGPEGLGFFAVSLTLLQFFVSMQTVFVGDAYTVLDRSDAVTQDGVSLWQVVHSAVGALIAAPVAVFAFGLRWQPALMLGALVAAWELEEFGRRAFMAHRRFGMQGLSDLLYALVALTLLLVAAATIGLSLTLALAVMTVSAMASFIFNQGTAPRGARVRLPKPTADALRVVASYGSWRAAQAGSGYLSQVALRYAVVTVISIEAMGQLEAARLVAAPLFTVLGASTNLLLPHFVHLRGTGYMAMRRRIIRVTAGVTFVAAGYAVVAVIGARPISHLLVGDDFPGDQIAVAAWCALGLVNAVTMSLSTAATTVLPSRTIFNVRSVGSALGLVIAVALLFVDGGPRMVPFGLAAGALVSGLLMYRATTANKDVWESKTAPVNK